MSHVLGVVSTAIILKFSWIIHTKKSSLNMLKVTSEFFLNEIETEFGFKLNTQ